MCIRDSNSIARVVIASVVNNIIFTRADKGNTVTVSYTHLDVYKRQAICLIMLSSD